MEYFAALGLVRRVGRSRRGMAGGKVQVLELGIGVPEEAFGMWLMPDPSDRWETAGPLPLDWEALGRLVRQRTSEAVDRHFGALPETPRRCPGVTEPGANRPRSEP